MKQDIIFTPVTAADLPCWGMAAKPALAGLIGRDREVEPAYIRNMIRRCDSKRPRLFHLDRQSKTCPTML